MIFNQGCITAFTRKTFYQMHTPEIYKKKKQKANIKTIVYEISN